MPPKNFEKTAEDPNPRRTANSVISLTQFAHSKAKGTRRAIEKYKQKKQTKFNHNAKLLREYKKVMKTEGYEAGKGASRKRNQDEVEDKNNDADEEGKWKKKQKSDPFAKAKLKAKQGRDEVESRKEDREQEIKQRAIKEKQKKAKVRKLSKRTKKGQPIMKDVIGDMLDKIKADSKK